VVLQPQPLAGMLGSLKARGGKWWTPTPLAAVPRSNRYDLGYCPRLLETVAEAGRTPPALSCVQGFPHRSSPCWVLNLISAGPIRSLLSATPGLPYRRGCRPVRIITTSANTHGAAHAAVLGYHRAPSSWTASTIGGAGGKNENARLGQFHTHFHPPRPGGITGDPGTIADLFGEHARCAHPGHHHYHRAYHGTRATYYIHAR